MICARYAAVLRAFARLATGCGKEAPPKVAPAGDATSGTTDALKAGAAAMQTHAPVNGMNVYVVDFHPMNAAPPAAK